MRSILIASLCALCACSDGVETVEWDAGPMDASGSPLDASVDAGGRDAGGSDAGSADAGADAGADAAADAAPDAEGPELPWPFFLEGDECDLVSQRSLAGHPPWVGVTCRREVVRIPGELRTFGRALFLPVGTKLDNSPTPCSETSSDPSKVCGGGMFCLGIECHLPCDPDGDPCRPTSLGNAPQECVSTERYPQPYCR